MVKEKDSLYEDMLEHLKKGGVDEETKESAIAVFRELREGDCTDEEIIPAIRVHIWFKKFHQILMKVREKMLKSHTIQRALVDPKLN